MSRWPALLSILIICAAATDSPSPERAVQPLYSKNYDRATLAHDFPPVLRDSNKLIVYRIAFPAGTAETGTLTVSRWPALKIPPSLQHDTNLKIECRPDYFTYDTPAPLVVEWHQNFADRDLFSYYSTGLFAQDEMQVAEHPILASLREALLHDHLSTFVVQDDAPTPILIKNAPRRVAISTDIDPQHGRPKGLYGNLFSQAPADAIRAATRRIDPPTLSNILAIEAPAHGHGEYTTDQLRFILITAYTGYRSALLQSPSPESPHPLVTIHTGFWGCGAYGGNRTVMAVLQLLAAQNAGINRFVFHAGDKAGTADFDEAKKLFQQIKSTSQDTDQVLEQLHSKKFCWSTSDGN